MSGRAVGVSLPPTEKECLVDMQETGAGDVPPPPRQPLPHGGRFPIDTVSGEETTTSRSHLTLPEILSPPPDTAIGPIGPPRPSSVSHRRVFTANPV